MFSVIFGLLSQFYTEHWDAFIYVFAEHGEGRYCSTHGNDISIYCFFFHLLMKYIYLSLSGHFLHIALFVSGLASTQFRLKSSAIFFMGPANLYFSSILTKLCTFGKMMPKKYLCLIYVWNSLIMTDAKAVGTS